MPDELSIQFLRVRGARTHNLKGIDADVPHRALTVITGPSGSGKSSLAFDTLYAEGQRRYVESMSTYARQFIERMERPDVDEVANLLPAIALEQKNSIKNARSTVGTATEIHDYLRLLWATLGETRCPRCDLPVRKDDVPGVLAALAALPAGTRATVLAPLAIAVKHRGAVRDGLLRAGFFRIWRDGDVADLHELLAERLPADLELVAGRHQVGGGENGGAGSAALAETLATAFDLGHGDLVVALAHGVRLEFSRKFACNRCGRVFRESVPALFSFNSPLGACPTCQGFGRVTGIDLGKVIPNRGLSLAEQPIAPWNTPAYVATYDDLWEATKKHKISRRVPIDELPAEHYRILLEGSGKWYGINGFFKWLEGRRYKVQARILLARYRAYTPCPDCGGARLQPDALAVRFRGMTLPELTARTVADLDTWFEQPAVPNLGAISEEALPGGGLVLSAPEQARAGDVVREIASRLRYLAEVGLTYLTLDRQARTLSGGESQRIHLATALGSGLTQTLYVLDEPTVGLHPRDSQRLLRILHALRDRGNTVVVVEHDREIIAGADTIIDLGPGAGELGGHVIFQGSYAELLAHPHSLTAKFLDLRRLAAEAEPAEPDLRRLRLPAGSPLLDPELPAILRAQAGRLAVHAGLDAAAAAPAAIAGRIAESSRVRDDDGPRGNHGARGGNGVGKLAAAFRPQHSIEILGASEHNLRNLDCAIPLGGLVVITGVSGSGKSTLIEDILYNGYQREVRGVAAADAGAYREIRGWEHVTSIQLIDQSPLGRSSRSNPATYVKAYDEIRKLLAGTGKAREARIKAGAFSFNIAGGRCETCEGAGTVTVDLRFLADVTVNCETCDGKRFQPKVLAVRWNGKNVSAILDLTAEEAIKFFDGQRALVNRLKVLRDAGLGYLRLGQSTATLSGGEAQRLKLASFLAAGGRDGPTLFLFDEPTTGLHLSDIATLVTTLRALIARGHSVVAVEHNLDFVTACDWVLDLGPEGGGGGGRLLYSGPVPGLAVVRDSHTGRFLAEHLRLD